VALKNQMTTSARVGRALSEYKNLNNPEVIGDFWNWLQHNYGVQFIKNKNGLYNINHPVVTDPALYTFFLLKWP
jgi:hypothetical protein